MKIEAIEEFKGPDSPKTVTRQSFGQIVPRLCTLKKGKKSIDRTKDQTKLAEGMKFEAEGVNNGPDSPLYRLDNRPNNSNGYFIG